MARLLVLCLLAAFTFHPQAACCAEHSHPNLILVTASGLRWDHVGFLGAKHPTSAIDGLARHSVIFEHGYAQSSATVASHASVLTGTYPQAHRASEFGSTLSADVPFLPDSLKEHGYRTAAFVGSIELDPINGFSPGFERGFDVYDAGFSFANPGNHFRSDIERPAQKVVERAVRWASVNPKPFFLWINLSDAAQAHDPASYVLAVDRVNAAVNRLVAFLQQNGLFDDTALVFCADHGEGLGGHGEDGHGIFLYDETTHVPLILKLPGDQSAGRRVSLRVSLIDLAPSLLELVGIAVPSRMQGQSLIRQAENAARSDRPIYGRSDFPAEAFGWSPLESWRAGKYLYIRAPHPELYDLSSDPAATHNLAQTSRATLATLAAQLGDFDRRIKSTGDSKRAPLDSTDMQKLASLGYVGLQRATPETEAIAGIDPKDNISLANKTLQAWSALHHDHIDSADQAFRSILKAQPTIFLAQWGLGYALALKQQCGQAIDPLRKSIELLPNVAWVHYQMGLCLDQLKNRNAAAVHFGIASHLSPENRVFRYDLNEGRQH